jgi:hypothetical protein
MSTIINYIQKYGDKTFKEKEINEVDYAILTTLSYLNFDHILYNNKKKVTLNDAVKSFFDFYTDKELKNHGLGLKDAYAIAKNLIDKKRYQHLKLYNYEYVTDESIQFCAMFIDIDPNTVFISVEGTDDEIVGWKEDFQMSYQFPIPSQRRAASYLNKHIPFFSKKNYIISGHSKGGNLALVGTMYMNMLKQHKIKEIYSFDGPGLKKEQLKSYRYLSVQKRFHSLIPNYSIVGLLFNNPKESKIIKSNVKGIYAHSIYNWDIIDDKFNQVNELSKFSKNLDKAITNWLNKYDYQTRREFVEDIFNVFERCNIETLYKIHAKDIKELLLIVRESGKLSDDTKEIIKELLSSIIDVIKEDTFTIRKSKQD